MTPAPGSPTSRLLLEYEMHLRNTLAKGMDAESYSLHTFEALLSQSMENLELAESLPGSNQRSPYPLRRRKKGICSFHGYFSCTKFCSVQFQAPEVPNLLLFHCPTVDRCRFVRGNGTGSAMATTVIGMSWCESGRGNARGAI